MKQKHQEMTLEDAKKIIRDDSAGYASWAIATGVIFYEANRNHDLYEDLLKCLERGGPCSGSAALALYSHSGRSRPENFLNNSRDPNEWRAYLVKNGMLEQG